MTEHRRLRIALAGAGRWGDKYLRTLSTLVDCALVGIAETNPARARATAASWAVPVFPSLESLLEEIHPDALVVATPDHTHVALAKTALEADCDVLVEKPLALSHSEALMLRDLALARSLVLAVGQTTAHHSGYHRLRASLEAGAIGRPVGAESTRTSHGTASGDPLWDLAPHSVALAFGLFGMPNEVNARREDDGVAFDLRYPTGLRFAARVAWTKQPPRRLLVVQGDRGSLEFDETKQLSSGDPLPLTLLCEDFVAACRTRNPPRANAELGVAVVGCIEMLAASARISSPEPRPDLNPALR